MASMVAPNTQSPQGTDMKPLVYGAFVKVKGSDDFRPGQDGMVVSDEDANGDVGMIFAYDRAGEAIRVPNLGGGSRYATSTGIELWNRAELDISTADHPPGRVGARF